MPKDKPSKSKLIAVTKTSGSVFLLTQRRSSVGILDVFMLVNARTLLSWMRVASEASSTPSVRTQPRNCRGQSLMTSRLPRGLKVLRPLGNRWRRPGPTGLSQQTLTLITQSLDSKLTFPLASSGFPWLQNVEHEGWGQLRNQALALFCCYSQG